MMKKWIIISLLLLVSLFKVSTTHAVEPVFKLQITPMACLGNICPAGFSEIYSQTSDPNSGQPPDSCATSYDDFLTNPATKHFWAEDPEATAQGKADERARQFIYWVLNTNAIDNHPVLKTIWNATSSMAFIFMLIVAAVMGIGFIVAQRANFELKIKVWPYVMKIFMGLLYIFLSWLIVFALIQISELLMKFFIDKLGGRNLFNVYFDSSSGSSEKGYSTFVGCRDLNIRVQEASDSETMLLRITNVTYYIMGIMLLLRKILLWFLLFLSPFLAILFPFVFIRNIGWIWIGVFFQWLFYGPLFALFLGALNTMWSVGIPFKFDFSRAGKISGYVYPTALRLVYGGPAQRGDIPIGPLNNGNYVDTFAEYIITLIMLWAVIFFPWLLLRIFRDYCCDGIYAMKNILLSMYDQMRGGPAPSPSSPTAPSQPRYTSGLDTRMPKETMIPLKVKLETIQEIKETKTTDISRSLSLTATKLTDIARFETNKSTKETINRNLNLLSNPTQASTPAERQKYMNIRTELFNRAIKQDPAARQILSVTSSSSVERTQKLSEIVRTTPQAEPMMNVVSVKVQLPKEKVSSINSSLVNSMTSNSSVINNIAQNTTVPAPQVATILHSYNTQINNNNSSLQTINNIARDTNTTKENVQNVITQIKNVTQTEVNKSLINAMNSNKNEVVSIAAETQTTPEEVHKIFEVYSEQKSITDTTIDTVAQKTNVSKEKVTEVLRHVSKVASKNKEIMQEVATKENVKVADVQSIVETQIPMILEPTHTIEQSISLPPSVSIEDYEDVKKMWTSQYEKGEVPVTENIKNRADWVDQDIVFISNTLNKLMSPDEKLKKDGADELGYILPIFIINNMKGNELLVYLKAKLEAAKLVKEGLEKEKEITEKVKGESSNEDDLVEVDRPKAEEAKKELHMSQEMDEESPEEGAAKEVESEQPNSPQTPIGPSAEPKNTDGNTSGGSNTPPPAI